MRFFMKTPFFTLNDFFPYFFIGAAATIMDWGVFWVLIDPLSWHYELALVFSYVTAGIFHFTANKMITFKCASKQIGSQYVIYIFLTLSALLVSMLFMAVLVNFLLLNSVFARILTTLLMLVPNYLLHKHLTFSKKIFIQPQS